MKKLLAILLSLIMVLGLVACGAEEAPAPTNAPDAAPAATEAAPEAAEPSYMEQLIAAAQVKHPLSFPVSDVIPNILLRVEHQALGAAPPLRPLGRMASTSLWGRAMT